MWLQLRRPARPAATHGLLTENVASARQLQDFEQSRFDHGLTNELDLQFSARELGRLQAKVPLLQSELKAV